MMLSIFIFIILVATSNMILTDLNVCSRIAFNKKIIYRKSLSPRAENANILRQNYEYLCKQKYLLGKKAYNREVEYRVSKLWDKVDEPDKGDVSDAN